MKIFKNNLTKNSTTKMHRLIVIGATLQFLLNMLMTLFTEFRCLNLINKQFDKLFIWLSPLFSTATLDIIQFAFGAGF